MRLGKLYIKIFLWFLLVLIVTEILIFGLFMYAAGRTFRYRIEQYTQAKVLILKDIMEDKIKSEPNRPLAENESLKAFIRRFEETFRAKVWLEASQGVILLKSFQGEIPDDIATISEKHAKDFGHFKLYHHFRRNWEFYAIIPIALRKGEMGSLHILFEDMGHPPIEKGFALGLAVIGIVIALLVIPVSRYITKRVNLLSHSALRIAEGELSHRAEVKGKDEIGKLCRAFNRMADKLERMIRGGRELTANISHELRSPLARIRVAEELLRERLERGDYEDLGRHLDDIESDIEELDRLIGRVLDLSKLDIQETPLNYDAFNPAHLTAELVEQLKPAMNRKKLGIETDLSTAPSFTGDCSALRTALSNILDNAVKYTPEGGHVTVEMHPENGWLLINITNSTEALSEEELVNIFEPFYRTKGAPEEGTGLGLAITRKIIERHGGSIEACNSEEGLMFLTRLPLSPPEGTI